MVINLMKIRKKIRTQDADNKITEVVASLKNLSNCWRFPICID